MLCLFESDQDDVESVPMHGTEADELAKLFQRLGFSRLVKKNRDSTTTSVSRIFFIICLFFRYTIENFILILIYRSFKKGTSDNNICYFDQSFWPVLWPLTYFGQRFGEIGSKSVKIIHREQKTEREQKNFFFIFNSVI